MVYSAKGDTGTKSKGTRKESPSQDKEITQKGVLYLQHSLLDYLGNLSVYYPITTLLEGGVYAVGFLDVEDGDVLDCNHKTHLP